LKEFGIELKLEIRSGISRSVITWSHRTFSELMGYLRLAPSRLAQDFVFTEMTVSILGIRFGSL